MKNNQQEIILDNIQNNFLASTRTQRELTLEVGESVSSALDIEKYFYFIIDGKLKISQVNFETSKEQTLYLLTRGDMLDVATLLDAQSHDYLGEVLEQCQLIEVPIEQVRRLLDEDKAFKQLFFPYVAKQLRSMEDLVVDLSLHDVYQRLIKLFARFIDRSSDKANLRVINNLSHEELASMVGSVRKVVNRALQRLKNEGIIDISRKRLELSNLKKLLSKLKDDV